MEQSYRDMCRDAGVNPDSDEGRQMEAVIEARQRDAMGLDDETTCGNCDGEGTVKLRAAGLTVIGYVECSACGGSGRQSP